MREKQHCWLTEKIENKNGMNGEHEKY